MPEREVLRGGSGGGRERETEDLTKVSLADSVGLAGSPGESIDPTPLSYSPSIPQ